MPNRKEHFSPIKNSYYNDRKESSSPSASPRLKFQVQKGTKETPNFVSQKMEKQRVKASSNKGGTISFGINKVSENDS